MRYNSRFMETATKSSLQSTERVLEALATLAALLDRTINEVKMLDSEFQQRLMQAVHDTESSLQQQASDHLRRALEEADQRIRVEVGDELKERLNMQMTAAVESVRQELTAEREKLTRELDRATQAAAQWEAERVRLSSEWDSTKQALEESRAEQNRLQAEVSEVRSAAAAEAKVEKIASTEWLASEVERVEGKIREISALIDDPATDLSIVIRKNVERAELDSYLKGIRFAIKGAKR
jgi:chromosome segregation ATPase